MQTTINTYNPPKEEQTYLYFNKLIYTKDLKDPKNMDNNFLLKRTEINTVIVKRNNIPRLYVPRYISTILCKEAPRKKEDEEKRTKNFLQPKRPTTH